MALPTISSIYLAEEVSPGTKNLYFMQLDDRIRKILEAAILAPSTENTQPWELVVKNSSIMVHYPREVGISILNFRRRESLIVHGTLIENILIASAAQGYEAKMVIFPDPQNFDLIATIELADSQVKKEEPLYPFIPQRITNRKPYHSTKLTDAEKSKLTEPARDFKTGRIVLIEDPGQIQRLASAMAAYDRLIFENRHIRRFLYDWIRWTDEEARATRDGLDVRTLELSKIQVRLFRQAGHPITARLFNWLGMAKIAVRRATGTIASSPAVGALIVSGEEYEDFIMAGRILERIWLEGTRMGLGFQPLAGMAVASNIILGGKISWISPNHVKMISNGYETIRQIFGFGAEDFFLCFRVGHADPPSARSLRYPLERVVRVVP